jgi:hypothetical protein
VGGHAHPQQAGLKITSLNAREREGISILMYMYSLVCVYNYNAGKRSASNGPIAKRGKQDLLFILSLLKLTWLCVHCYTVTHTQLHCRPKIPHFPVWIFKIFKDFIQHCFICRPLDSTMPKNAGLSPGLLRLWSDSLTTRLDRIHMII